MSALDIRRLRPKNMLSDPQPADTSIRSILERLNGGEEQQVVASPSFDLTQEPLVDDRRSRFRAGIAIAAGIGGVTLAAVVAVTGSGSPPKSDMAQPVLDATRTQTAVAGKGDLEKVPLEPVQTTTATPYPQAAAASMGATVAPALQPAVDAGSTADNARSPDDGAGALHASHLLLASPLQLWAMLPAADSAPQDASAPTPQDDAVHETTGTTPNPAVSAPATEPRSRQHVHHAFHHHRHRHRRYAAPPAETAESSTHEKQQQQQADVAPQKPAFQDFWQSMFGAK